MEIEDETTSEKNYRTDLRYNLLGLDFIKSLDLLGIPLYSVCNAVSRSPAQCAITDDTIKHFNPVFIYDLWHCTHAEITLTLKPSATPVFQL